MEDESALVNHFDTLLPESQEMESCWVDREEFSVQNFSLETEGSNGYRPTERSSNGSDYFDDGSFGDRLASSAILSAMCGKDTRATDAMNTIQIQEIITQNERSKEYANDLSLSLVSIPTVQLPLVSHDVSYDENLQYPPLNIDTLKRLSLWDIAMEKYMELSAHCLLLPPPPKRKRAAQRHVVSLDAQPKTKKSKKTKRVEKPKYFSDKGCQVNLLIKLKRQPKLNNEDERVLLRTRPEETSANYNVLQGRKADCLFLENGQLWDAYVDMKHLLKEVRILTREKRRESNTSEDRRLSLASRLKIILPMLIENFVKRTNADHDQYFDDRIVLAAVELFLAIGQKIRAGGSEHVLACNPRDKEAIYSSLHAAAWNTLELLSLPPELEFTLKKFEIFCTYVNICSAVGCTFPSMVQDTIEIVASLGRKVLCKISPKEENWSEAFFRVTDLMCEFMTEEANKAVISHCVSFIEEITTAWRIHSPLVSHRCGEIIHSLSAAADYLGLSQLSMRIHKILDQQI